MSRAGFRPRCEELSAVAEVVRAPSQGVAVHVEYFVRGPRKSTLKLGTLNRIELNMYYIFELLFTK